MTVSQTCQNCGKKISGEFRMVLMMGPKGYRRYAVHPSCAGNVPVAREGGRQREAMDMRESSTKGADVPKGGA